MNDDVAPWLANELAHTKETQLVTEAPGLVTGRVATGLGDSELVFQQFTTNEASLGLHVAPEPEGPAEELVRYHQRLDQYRSSLFDRRIDSLDGELFYGKDLVLPERPGAAQELVGSTLADLAEELPSVRRDFLNMTEGLRAKRV